VFDAAPIGKSFGDVLINVQPAYSRGDTVVAQFVGANPRVSIPLFPRLSLKENIDTCPEQPQAGEYVLNNRPASIWTVGHFPVRFASLHNLSMGTDEHCEDIEHSS
jgi:hypothetical protein